MPDQAWSPLKTNAFIDVPVGQTTLTQEEISNDERTRAGSSSANAPARLGSPAQDATTSGNDGLMPDAQLRSDGVAVFGERSAHDLAGSFLSNIQRAHLSAPNAHGGRRLHASAFPPQDATWAAPADAANGTWNGNLFGRSQHPTPVDAPPFGLASQRWSQFEPLTAAAHGPAYTGNTAGAMHPCGGMPVQFDPASSPDLLRTGPAWDQLPSSLPPHMHAAHPDAPSSFSDLRDPRFAAGGHVGGQDSQDGGMWRQARSLSTPHFGDVASVTAAHAAGDGPRMLGGRQAFYGKQLPQPRAPPGPPPPPARHHAHAAPPHPYPAPPPPAARGPAEHPLGEYPSRTLFVRNINIHTSDDELLSLFRQFGEVRSMYAACKHRGFVMISYFDIRAATRAKQLLQGVVLQQRSIDIHYSVPKDNSSEADPNQGTLVVFNMDACVPRQQVLELFSRYGEVKDVRSTPRKDGHKFVEFFDSRHAAAALQGLHRAFIAGKQLKIELSRPGGVRRARNSNPNLVALDADHAAPGAGFPRPPSSSSLAGSQAASAANLQALFSNMMLNDSGDGGATGGAVDERWPPARSHAVAPTQPPPPPPPAFRMPCSVHDSVQSTRATPEVVGSASEGSQSASNTRAGSSASPPPAQMDGKADAAASLPLCDSASSMSDVHSAILRQLATAPAAPGALGGTPSDAVSASYGRLVQSLVHGPGPAAASPLPASPAPAQASAQIDGASNTALTTTLAAAAASAMAALSRDASVPPEEHEARLQQHLMEQIETMQKQSAAAAAAAAPAPPAPRAAPPAAGARFSDSPRAAPPLPPPTSVARFLDSPRPATGSPRPLGAPRRGSDACFSPATSYGAGSAASAELFLGGKRSSLSNEQFIVQRSVIGTGQGEDPRATLMIRNIPNKYLQKDLMAAIDAAGFVGQYDFFYLPIDFKNHCNVGYAFINMVSTDAVKGFYDAFHDQGWQRFNSEKRCCVAYGRIQTRRALVSHFQNSSLLHEDEQCRPVLLHVDDGGMPRAEHLRRATPMVPRRASYGADSVSAGATDSPRSKPLAASSLASSPRSARRS